MAHKRTYKIGIDAVERTPPALIQTGSLLVGSIGPGCPIITKPTASKRV